MPEAREWEGGVPGGAVALPNGDFFAAIDVRPAVAWTLLCSPAGPQLSGPDVCGKDFLGAQPWSRMGSDGGFPEVWVGVPPVTKSVLEGA